MAVMVLMLFRHARTLYNTCNWLAVMGVVHGRSYIVQPGNVKGRVRTWVVAEWAVGRHPAR
jgi:hypothetical protein